MRIFGHSRKRFSFQPLAVPKSWLLAFEMSAVVAESSEIFRSTTKQPLAATDLLVFKLTAIFNWRHCPLVEVSFLRCWFLLTGRKPLIGGISENTGTSHALVMCQECLHWAFTKKCSFVLRGIIRLFFNQRCEKTEITFRANVIKLRLNERFNQDYEFCVKIHL